MSLSKPIGECLQLAKDAPRRMAITLIALLVYEVGTHVPLPSFQPAALDSLVALEGSLAQSRVSIFALGVIPLLSALLVGELLRLVFGLRSTELAGTGLRSTEFNRAVLVGALALSALQGWGLAIGYEQMPGLVIEPGWEFRIGVIASLIGSTALSAWLADLITRHGVGSGFWLLYLVPLFDELPGHVSRLIDQVDTGRVASGSLLLVGALNAGGMLLTAAVVGTRAPSRQGEGLIWPLMLAFASVGYVPLVLMPIVPGLAEDLMAHLYDRLDPVRLAVSGALIAIFAMAWAWRYPVSGNPRPSPRILALFLVGMALAGEIIIGYANIPFALDGRQIVILTVVGLSVATVLLPRKDHA